MIQLSTESTVALDIIIQAFVHLQNQLAPLDNYCDTVIDSMTVLKSGADRPDPESFRRLAEAGTACTGLVAAIMGLAVTEPLLGLIIAELEQTEEKKT